jgi:hypothetical protein
MAAMGVLLGDVMIVLTFAAAAATASMRHHSVAQRELGLMKLCKY